MLDEVSAELIRLAQVCRERAEACRQALAAQQDYAGRVLRLRERASAMAGRRAHRRRG